LIHFYKRSSIMAEEDLLGQWENIQYLRDQLANAQATAFDDGDRELMRELSLGPNPTYEEKMKRSDEIDRKSLADFKAKLMKIVTGRIPVPISYEDSDQTPLKGDEAQYLRAQWSRGMDYIPDNPYGYLSSWFRCIYDGDIAAFMEHLRNKSDEEVKMMLRKRESMLNVGALVHVIQGARALHGDHRHYQRERAGSVSRGGHMQIFYKLLSLTTEVDSRDIAGFTPLHTCVTYGNDVTMKMAEMLIFKGADVNAKSRFGTTPLMACIMNNDIPKISFLLDHGADPDVKDNDGVTPRECAMAFPTVLNLIGKADAKKAKEERNRIHEEAGLNFKQCKVCKSYNRDTKRCTGCYLEWYCSPNCHKEDWPNHKKDCKKTRKEYIPVKVQLQFCVGTSHITGKHYTNVGKDKKPSKGHFISKIQIAFGGKEGDQPLRIYSEDRTLFGHIEKVDNEDAYKAITATIKDKGFRGEKGFFYTIYNGKEGDGEEGADGQLGKLEVSINVQKMLPVEKW